MWCGEHGRLLAGRQLLRCVGRVPAPTTPQLANLQMPPEEKDELLNTQSARCMNCGTPYCLNKTTGGWGGAGRGGRGLRQRWVMGCPLLIQAGLCVHPAVSPHLATLPTHHHVWPPCPPTLVRRLPPGQPDPGVERAGAPGAVGGGAAPPAGDQQLPRVHGWGWGGGRVGGQGGGRPAAAGSWWTQTDRHA